MGSRHPYLEPSPKSMQINLYFLKIFIYYACVCVPVTVPPCACGEEKGRGRRKGRRMKERKSSEGEEEPLPLMSKTSQPQYRLASDLQSQNCGMVNVCHSVTSAS